MSSRGGGEGCYYSADVPETQGQELIQGIRAPYMIFETLDPQADPPEYLNEGRVALVGNLSERL